MNSMSRRSVLASRSSLVCVGLVALAAGLSACDTIKAPGAGRADPLPRENYPQITSLDGLSQWIGYDSPIVNRDSVLKVTAPARALTDGHELNVQYRFFFLDESGRPLTQNPDWRYMRMPSRSQVFFEGNALDKSAKDWRLEVRPAR
jgi:predicted small secreted protein